MGTIKKGCVPPNGHSSITEHEINGVLTYYPIRQQKEIAILLGIKQNRVKHIIHMYCTLDKKNDKYTEFYDGMPVSIHANKRKKYKYIRLNKDNWYPLGRYVLEQHIGRKLTDQEAVFYKHNTLDCSISNLEVIQRRDIPKRNENREKSKAGQKRYFERLKTSHIYGLKARYSKVSWQEIKDRANNWPRGKDGKFLKRLINN